MNQKYIKKNKKTVGAIDYVIPDNSSATLNIVVIDSA